MIANPYKYLSDILGVDGSLLELVEKEMEKRTGKKNIFLKVAEENECIIKKTLKILKCENENAKSVLSVLRKAVYACEEQLNDFLSGFSGSNEFEKAVNLAKEVIDTPSGFFLKKDKAREILEKRKPENLFKYLKVKNLREALEKHDVLELFSALRFVESDEWMHKTFEDAYGGFNKNDFEQREIEVKVLGPAWRKIAEKFVTKKHHNVSHLKEFGVIFINPVREKIPGKIIRDFSLIFHYSFEIIFYTRLFERYFDKEDFAPRFKMFLRGDVQNIYAARDGQWLISQRYLTKENKSDPRLFLPRVNPEALHWSRAEKCLADLSVQGKNLELDLWKDLGWIGGIFDGEIKKVISFDLEDNAMSLVAFMEGREEIFNYHQVEAMWTKIFSEYAGGEEKMEEMLIKNFDKGIIEF